MADQNNKAASPSRRPQKRGTGVFLPKTAAAPAASVTGNPYSRAAPSKAITSQQLRSSSAASSASSLFWQHQPPNLLSCCSDQCIQTLHDSSTRNSWSAASSQLAAQPGQQMTASNSQASNSSGAVLLPAAVCPSSATNLVQGCVPSADMPEAGILGVAFINAPVQPVYSDLFPVNGFDGFPQTAALHIPPVHSPAVVDASIFSSSTVLGPQVPTATVCPSPHSSSWRYPAVNGMACPPATATLQQRNSGTAAVQNTPTDIHAGSASASAEPRACISSCTALEDVLAQELLMCSSSSSGSSSVYQLCMSSDRATAYSGASAACNDTSSTKSSHFAIQAVQEYDSTWQRQLNASLLRDLGIAHSTTVCATAAGYNSHALQLSAATSPSVLNSSNTSSTVLPNPFSGLRSPVAGEAGHCPASTLTVSRSIDCSPPAGLFPASTFLAGTCSANTSGSNSSFGICPASSGSSSFSPLQIWHSVAQLPPGHTAAVAPTGGLTASHATSENIPGLSGMNSTRQGNTLLLSDGSFCSLPAISADALSDELFQLLQLGEELHAAPAAAEPDLPAAAARAAASLMRENALGQAYAEDTAMSASRFQ